MSFINCLLIVFILLVSAAGCGNLRYVGGMEKKSPNSVLGKPDQGDDERNRNSNGGLITDIDKDGLSDEVERRIGTDPSEADTDGDGLSDGTEHNTVGTNPLLADTDGGGVNDGDELQNGTNPVNDPTDDLPGVPASDQDGDGVSDEREGELGTDPNLADTDGDGLSDGNEIAIGTNPLKPDTDGGGVSDGDEVNAGTNPIDDPSDDSQIVCPHDFYLNYWEEDTAAPFDSGFSGNQVGHSFLGLPSAKENYNYRSFSAHPLVGPQPENDVLFVYLYKSPQGVSLFFHANANRSDDEKVERVEMEFLVHSSSKTPDVILSDESFHLKNEGNGRFVSKMRHKWNSDGGVIGHLGNTFDISINVLSYTNIKKVVFSSNGGGNSVESTVLTEEVLNGEKALRIQSKSCF